MFYFVILLLILPIFLKNSIKNHFFSFAFYYFVQNNDIIRMFSAYMILGVNNAEYKKVPTIESG